MLHKTVFAFLNRLLAIVTPQLICETILNLDWSVSVRFFLYYVSGSFHKVQKCKKKWCYWWYSGSVVFLPKNCLFCIIPFTRQGSIWWSSWRRRRPTSSPYLVICARQKVPSKYFNSLIKMYVLMHNALHIRGHS